MAFGSENWRGFVCTMEFYAQPCVQPTRLRRERVGAIFGNLGYAKIVLKLQSRRAADAPVGRFFSFFWLGSLKIEVYALCAKNLACQVFACCENLYIFSRFGVFLWLVAKCPKLAGFANFLLCQKTHFRLHVEGAKFGFCNENNCLKCRKQKYLF